MSVYNPALEKSASTIDVLIVGAGPAGLASAITLGKLGYRTLLIDKAPTLPLRVGECLPAKGANSLKQLGLDKAFFQDQHMPLQGYQVKWGDDAIYEKHLINTTYGTGWLLDRAKFDAMLVKAAEENRCDIQFNTRLSGLVRFLKNEGNKNDSLKNESQTSDNQESNNHWQVTLKTGQEEKQIAVKAVIDASGRARALTRRLHIPQARSDSLVASVCHIQHTADANLPYNVQIVTDTNGWWYSAPVNTVMSVLMYFTDSDLALPSSASEHLILAQRLTEFKTHLEQDKTTIIEGSFKQIAAYSSALSCCAGEGWLAVGDAACSYDPLSSYGITSALGSGYYAGLALDDALCHKPNALEAYQQLMQQTFMEFLTKQQQEYQDVTQHKTTFWQRRHADVGFKAV